MKKKILVILSLAALVTLLGAGCSGMGKQEQNQGNSDQIKLNLDGEQATSELTLSAKAMGAGEIKLTWQGGPSAGGWRLMHSGKNLPNDNAYWQWLAPDKKEFDWSGIPAGKRYFRVCAWESDKCGALSNELQVEVK